MSLNRACAGKSHRQLAVESDDDTSNSLSLIKKYIFNETIAAVSVLKYFTADRVLDDISMFNIKDKLQDSRENKIHRLTILHQFIFQTAVVL